MLDNRVNGLKGGKGINGVNDYNSQIHPLQRSTKYYIPGGDLHLVVGDTRFRIHSYFFLRESTKFQNALSQSSSDAPGSSLSNALVLHNVTPQQFEKFLWIFYNPHHSLYEASVGSWASILRLANRWDFPEVRSLAIRELEKQDLSVVDRILIYQEQDVEHELIVPLYSQLVVRNEFITPEEHQKLGDKTTIMLLQARERLRATPSDASEGVKSLPVDMDTGRVQQLLENMMLMFPPTAPLDVSASSPLTPKVHSVSHTNGIHG
ncbi:hypothetical protein K435DRAFT_23612 [Dendrothele bispora CBS 962.96]|uniref:BTB domain-containing protein n=1 Tax=Dendrothele bispora (strain CBS 962.96) TaxID=1314807 RepID=A0A4S8MSQ7_DENBC|nr:hypothetical protein K435DRAFT_23612 [Dendrothele bispora CBS 962.96]